MENKRGRYINLKKLNSYVEKCFRDAYSIEGHAYNSEEVIIEYVLLQNDDGVFYFYPLFDCNYQRVLNRVEFRLQNNLKKNFGIYWHNETYNFSWYLEFDGSISPNQTKAAFNTSDGIAYLNLWTERDKTCLFTETGVISTTGRLIMTYYNLSIEECEKINDYKLPKEILNDWEQFKELWNKAIGEEICPYKILCSKGIKRL